MRLKDKVAVVTGAGSGIGRGIALDFANEGAKVVVSDVDEEGGAETVKQIIESTGKASFFKCDVSKSEQVGNLIKATLDEFGSIDILVNNAGIVKQGPTHEQSEDDFSKVIDVNLKGLFLTSKMAIPEMIKSGGGKIVNIASIAGLVGFESTAAYCASKGGIIAMSKSMAVEYGKDKININVIAPGVIKTNMTKNMLEDEQTKKGFTAATPYPRLGKPSDIAKATTYLASEESDFVTGEVVVVDGGWIAK
jgi:NAD(P)-dependent dehydrogenase (short-subunit alcohol dehydrogenase family)